MIKIDKQLIDQLYIEAEGSVRKRMNYDLRNSENDGSQRMLNALLPNTCVPIHRHPKSNETFVCLCGKLVEVLYEEVDDSSNLPQGMDVLEYPSGIRLRESARYVLDPKTENFGCVVPANTWHTVEVLEKSVIYESKDGKFGEDGSETL